ncbi:MAG: autotransporter outer membrane beta-barrel domain-containing protein [Parvibaculaceae bacterium]
MAKPLNWMLSGAPTNKATSRVLRNRLAATTILAVVPFLGYGRQAYAACEPAGAPLTHLCSGANTDAQAIIDFDNANVATAPGFSVTTTDNADGLAISGRGDIRFTDDNNSTITSENGRGLSVVSDDIPDSDDPGYEPDAIGSVTITTTGGEITGGYGDGIYARNRGSGDIAITVGGIITGEAPIETRDVYPYDSYTVVPADGIYARNAGANLTITTTAGSDVFGTENGIDARNGYAGEDGRATGDLEINAYGYVTGYLNDGIHAENHGLGLTITTTAQSVVRGGGHGIYGFNRGYGNLTINANGWVEGYSPSSDGINAYNVAGLYPYPEPSGIGYGRSLVITTGAGSTVLGGDDGIQADNQGSGGLTITVGGRVEGYGGDGINAHNGYGTDLQEGEGEEPDIVTALDITTSAASSVTGDYDGIFANNRGDGIFSITAYGDVTGREGTGIYAENSGSGEMRITTGPDSDVFGGKDGIDAINDGFGSLTISVDGRVTGAGNYDSFEKDGGDGIYARNLGSSLTIETGLGSVVTGVRDDGIEAEQYGDGDLTITVNGTVTGQGEDGSGIDAYNGGFSIFQLEPDPERDETIITVGGGGVVEGNFAGIRAVSGYDENILITNNGMVRNLSGDSSKLAIYTDGRLEADTHVENNLNLIGTVQFDGAEGTDTLDNKAFWNMAGGTSDFGDQDDGEGDYESYDDVVNNTGTLVAADDPTGDPEISRILRLEQFNNDGGLISMIDGQAGDTFLITDQPEGDGIGFGSLKYTGTNGRLAVDAALGPEGVSDLFDIDGTVEGEGTTTIGVNVVSASGFNFEGIPVVHISQGDNPDEPHFALDAPVNGGFFLWGLQYDEIAQAYELYTLDTNGDGTGDPILGAGASEFPAGFAAAQDVWMQTIGTVFNRQADLRALLQGMTVTPVADYSEPVEPTPVAPAAIMSPGFWFKGFGAYAERDDEANGADVSNKQTTYGGMAGFDFGTKEAVGDALLFGLFGGYVVSDLEFKATNSEWNYEGPTVGAYVTYLDQAFYADLTVKADFLDIDIDPQDVGMGDDADTDAVSVGGRLDTGYKFGHTAFVEPQASLAVVHTEIDEVDVFGGTVDFDDDTSVLGRLGLRVGVDHTSADSTVYTADVTASVWEDFTGGNDASISVPGSTDLGVSDDPASTYGDISLGLSAANPDGWSSFLRANYLFADDYEAVTGNAGVRFVW